MKVSVKYEQSYFWIELWKTKIFSGVEFLFNECETDVTVTIKKDVFVNVDNLVPFLESKVNYKDSNIEITYKDPSNTITEHPDIHQCNYLGFVFINDIPKKIKDVNLDTLICCCNMTVKMMEVYYNWKGIEPFYKPPEDIIINPNWTLVTAFYDLPSMSDASSSLRDLEYYYSNCLSTLSLNYNMIIFCDKSTYQRVYDIRKRYGLLEKKTLVYVTEFENFPMNIYRDRIVENRKKIPSADPRNTISYYLFCMARYAMLKISINSNPFSSTHYAWINFCISRMGLLNIELLDESLNLNREKISTVFIDYIPRKEVESRNFVRRGSCSLCSGFFTGKKDYMYEFCDMMEKEFINLLSEGVGHSDEQVIKMCWSKRSDLFDCFFGDYQSMISNYKFPPRIKPIDALKFLIPKSYNDSRYDLCSKACKWTFEGYKIGYYGLSANELIDILKIWHPSCYYQNDVETCRMIMKEFKKILENKNMYEIVKTNLISIIQITDYHRLKDISMNYKKLVIVDSDNDKYLWNTCLDTDNNYYIIYGNYPITKHCLINNRCISLRPMYVKY